MFLVMNAIGLGRSYCELYWTEYEINQLLTEVSLKTIFSDKYLTGIVNQELFKAARYLLYIVVWIIGSGFVLWIIWSKPKKG